ncbi:MAG: membrane protein insertion efficiency factor YidD [Sulfuricella sp.]
MPEAMIALIRLYQRIAPTRLRRCCRYDPSCSNYMILAVQKHGVLVGVSKGVHRLFHCHPPFGGTDYP